MSIHRAVLGVGITITTVALGAMWLTGAATRTEPARATDDEAPVDPIRALQRDVELLKARVARPLVVLPSSAQPTRDEATSEPPASEPAAKPARAFEPAEVAQMLEAHHASEPLDRGWGDTVQAELGTALPAQPTGTTLSTTQCGRSLCKVTLLHDTVDAQRDLASHVARLPALRAGVFYHYDSSDPPRTVLYVVRNGHQIGDMLVAQ